MRRLFVKYFHGKFNFSALPFARAASTDDVETTKVEGRERARRNGKKGKASMILADSSGRASLSAVNLPAAVVNAPRPRVLMRRPGSRADTLAAPATTAQSAPR